MQPQSHTDQIAWIARCVVRLKRMERAGKLSFRQYVRLVRCLLGEHTRDT